jgi:hypothetical protein
MPRKIGSVNVFEATRKVGRVVVNLPDDIRQAVQEKADALGVPVQAVAVVLLADWAGVPSHVKAELADKVVSNE